MQHHPMYIGGHLIADGEKIEVACPATEKPFASIAWAGPDQADAALASAASALPSFSRTTIQERIELMGTLRAKVLENEELLRETVMLEVGKTWAQTKEDVQSLADSLEFYALEISRTRLESLPDRTGSHRHQLRSDAVGVVIAFLAWNFPLLNLGFKLGPALAAGCPIVVKPSPKSPVSAYLVGGLCAEVGFPAGVVNVICGPDETVSARLAASEIPALLTLIGSAATARKIMAVGSSSIKRYSMELGGNAPVLVFDDADVRRAVDVVASLKFGNAGQICVAPNRVFLDAQIREQFTRLIVERARATRVGFGRHADVEMGPVIDRMALERLEGLINEAVRDGAVVLAGGARAPSANAGHFLEPTVLANVRPEMAIAREEVFGPVVSLMSFFGEQHAIELANDTPTGLVAYLFTKDLDRVERGIAELRFGEIQVNGAKYGIDLPHGGIKQSGVGHDCSHLALRDYLAVKRVSTAMTTSSANEAQSH